MNMARVDVNTLYRLSLETLERTNMWLLAHMNSALCKCATALKGDYVYGFSTRGFLGQNGVNDTSLVCSSLKVRSSKTYLCCIIVYHIAQDLT